MRQRARQIHLCTGETTPVEMETKWGKGGQRTISGRSDSRAKRCIKGNVRALDGRDVARVAELYENVLGKGDQASSDPMGARLQSILLDHPWYDDAVPSLVFEDENDRIIGCIGVMPRPMLFNGRKITAAVSHSFIVEPGSRSSLAALELARHFLSGPQDLSMAEGSNVSRRIWERNGGSTSLLYSLSWTRPLQPSRYVLSFLSRRGLSPAVGWALKPFCRLMDTVTPLISHTPFHLPEPVDSEEDLDGETLWQNLAEFETGHTLHPHYDGNSSSWLLERLARNKNRGTLQKVNVLDGRRTLGWYVYYENFDGTGEVVQIGAKGDCIDRVLDHLFYRAKKNGLVAVTGQMDPGLFPALARRNCLFHHDGGSWMLIHSRYPELVDAVHRGDAFLTRMDGEWWISSLLG